jgi:beta-lactamase regulating signal transducer with metallopeptidase domain/predicted peptidase
MNAILDSITSLIRPEILSGGLLLAKLTIILSLFLLFRYAFASRPAAFRHGFLTIGLLGIPLVLMSHFFAPSWSIPGTDGWMTRLTTSQHLQFATENSCESELTPVVGLKDESVDHKEDQQASEIGVVGCENVEAETTAQSNQLAGSNNSPNSDEFVTAPLADTGWRATEDSTAPAPAFDLVKSIEASSVGERGVTWFSGLSYQRVRNCLLIVWAVGMAVMLVRLKIAWLVVSRAVGRAKRLDEWVLGAVLPASTSELLRGISRQGIRIRIAQSKTQTPLGFGVLQKTILLPSSCFQWTESQWKSVALHEFAHFRRRDCLINLVARIQQAILWFHPLVWSLVSQIRAESENACDDFVIQSGVSNVEYADMLFQVAQQSSSNRYAMIATVTMSDATPLETRIESILSPKTRRHPVRPLMVLLATLFAVAIVIPISTAQFFSTADASPPVSSLDGPVLELAAENATESSAAAIVQSETTLHFFVTLKNGETFVGKTKTDLEVESTFGKSTFNANQVALLKSTNKQANQFRIEAADGSTVFGRLKQNVLVFEIDKGNSVSVDVETLESASLIGRSGLAAETIADGFAKNKVTYHIRAPKGYDANRQYPAIVLLHGSNSNSKKLIELVAKQWPKLANQYLLIGINGEHESDDSDDGADVEPAYNYTYVNFVGASKYKGYPGTHRESPALVAEVIEEIRDYVPISTIFLGGSSEGGWLTYSMYMNFPELIDGAFPISGAMIIQCQPDAYDNATVRALQRDTPIAIIHPQDDKSLSRAYTDVAQERYLEDGFPMLSLFSQNADGDELGGENFVQAILWLESMSQREEASVLQVVTHLIGQDRSRDAVGMLTRIDFSKKSDVERDEILRTYESIEAREKASVFETLITENASNDWIDSFLDYREKFEFAPSAKTVMEEFAQLRQKHAEPADKLFTEIRSLFDENENDQAYAKCEELVDKYYAARRYRYAKKKLAERDEAAGKSKERP